MRNASFTFEFRILPKKKTEWKTKQTKNREKSAKFNRYIGFWWGSCAPRKRFISNIDSTLRVCVNIVTCSLYLICRASTKFKKLNVPTARTSSRYEFEYIYCTRTRQYWVLYIQAFSVFLSASFFSSSSSSSSSLLVRGDGVLLPLFFSFFFSFCTCIGHSIVYIPFRSLWFRVELCIRTVYILDSFIVIAM